LFLTSTTKLTISRYHGLSANVGSDLHSVATRLDLCTVGQFFDLLLHRETVGMLDDELIKGVEAFLSGSPKYHAEFLGFLVSPMYEEDTRNKVVASPEKK